MASWVFQGNPDKYDIDDYLTRYPELIYWRTPRYVKEIVVGDRAFMWRAGADAGAVALGVVVEEPTQGTKVKHPEALGVDLWRAEQPDLEEAKTGIHLHDIRLSYAEGFVSRLLAMTDPVLARSPIITIPNGTVFRLTPDQGAALERLWGLGQSEVAIPAGEAWEGERKLRAHYRRERSDNLRNKKLAEVRRLHGKCVCALCGEDGFSKYPADLGNRIFEVHHLAPLSSVVSPVRTTLEDVAVLCASCHRAVHGTPAVEENFASLAVHLRRDV